MYIGQYRINNTISFSFQALDGNGIAIDTTGTPSFEVYKVDSPMDPPITGSLTKVVGRTGFYVGELEVAEADGFEVDYTYIIRISATIDGVPTISLQTFNLVVAESLLIFSEANVVQPLYNTKSDLLSKIRMATVADSQTLSVINMAITEVRLNFFSRLTATRALEIAAYTSSDIPTTTQDILKNIAKTIEVLWITALLVDQLPFMVLDNSSNVRDEFNDEPLTRDSRAIAKYKENLISRINKMLGKLENPENSNSGDFQAFTCGAVDSEGNAAPYLISENFVGKIL
jgi:hypothetical protein